MLNEPLSVLYEISQLLNTELDKATLATCVGMVENGVNPEALAVRLVYWLQSTFNYQVN